MHFRRFPVLPGSLTVVRKLAACVAATSCLLGATAHAQDQASTVMGAGASANVPAAVTANNINPALSFYNEAGNYAHIAPTIQYQQSIQSRADSGPLLYNGGPVMTSLNIYSIFWTPPKLQSGATPPAMSAAYKSLVTQMAADYSGHSLSSLASQYYQTVNGVTTFISGLVGVIGKDGDSLGTYVDTKPFPVSACVPAAVNCVSDAQIQAEVARVLALKGWTGGLNKVFMVYLVADEETCLTANACSNTAFCGYHSHFTDGAGATVIYTNMPFANPANCTYSGTPSPNNNQDADQEMSTAAHEITESITDPLGSSWFTAQGNEIGDLCNAEMGTNTFDYSSTTKTYLANQMWNGHYYELQMMFDNHYGVCGQYGP